MPCLRAAATRVAFCCAVLTSASAASAQSFRQGGEFLVNAHTINTQAFPSIAVEADGDFVVTWTNFYDGYLTGVFGHRFNSVGARVGLQFQINTYTTNLQSFSSVASESNGDFVVVWQSFRQDGGVPGGYGVFARQFTSSGTALATEFQVNAYTTNDQESPRVASDSDGDFIVVWQSTGQDAPGLGGSIHAQRFSSSGTAQAAEFRVNTRTLDNQFLPAVAADADGDFVVTWQSNQQEAPGSSYGIFAKRFNSSGVEQAAEFQVNTYTVGAQMLPTVATRADGDFVIAWNSQNQESPGGNLGIFARRFTSAGVRQAVEFQVNVRTTDLQAYPRIAADDNGDFVVTWDSMLQDGDEEGVFARRIVGNSTFGPEFQVNSYTPDGQVRPVVDFDADGDFVIAWYTKAAQDGGSYGIFAQRFSLPPLATIDVDGNGILDPLTDGILILRHHFGFTMGALTNGAVGINCTRCDGPTITSYLTSLGMTLDIDNNGGLDPLTDGILVVRFLFGFSGPALTNGAVAQNCVTRCDSASIVSYLQTQD